MEKEMAAAQAGPSSSTLPTRKSSRPASNAAEGAAPGKKGKKEKNKNIIN
jgi:hypothetical protein